MQRNFSYYWGDALHCRCLSSIFRAWIRKTHMPSRSNYSISALSNIPNSLIATLDAWMLPQEYFANKMLESDSEATFGPKRHYSYRCYLYVFVRRVKGPNFWVSSVEYFIGLLSLGRGHNVAQLITRVLWSLRHAARLETSWPWQSGCVIWLQWSANKGGLPCHCPGDCGGLCPYALYFVGATAPTAPLPRVRHLCTRKLQSKRRHFFLPHKAERFGTIAAGPVILKATPLIVVFS